MIEAMAMRTTDGSACLSFDVGIVSTPKLAGGNRYPTTDLVSRLDLDCDLRTRSESCAVANVIFIF